MASSSSLIHDWQQLLFVSNRLLSMARENKWDELIAEEVEYLQRIESTAGYHHEETPIPDQEEIREILSQLIENESEVKHLLGQRMDELKILIHQGNQQQSLSSVYGKLSGTLLPGIPQ